MRWHTRIPAALMVALGLALTPTGWAQTPAASFRPELRGRPHGNFSNHLALPLRYWPVQGDYVITNGTECFNRPLYCLNSACRIDGGDQPEFSLYLPGHGGNLRLGIRTRAGVKWLGHARQIITRYRPGSLIYDVRDPWLEPGGLRLTVLPLSDGQGLIARVELAGATAPVALVFAFGGMDGLRGARGGDIGCERLPVAELFQLRPETCRQDVLTLAAGGFTLRRRQTVITGVTPPGARLFSADAADWDAPERLLATGRTPLRLLAGDIPLPAGQPAYLLLQHQLPEDNGAAAAAGLPAWFAAAENRRAALAAQVVVRTPDAYINAAAAALCVAAGAVWDARQQAFMHGAVAWRTRLLGWRGPYAGDALGWHDRTAAHFAGFAREQNVEPVPAATPPPDERFHLARSEAALHSNGDLAHNHYDMNLVGVDAFFRHLQWTGDRRYAAGWWPVIERHFAWERRLFRRGFGPEHLPLYEAYAAIWASDDLSYNGGGTAHASAYNYYANTLAARAARWLGKNPAPYQREAALILRGMNRYLWLPDQGHFAECKDWLGRQQTHPDPGLWTFYTVLDSGVASPAQAWQMARWEDQHAVRIPIGGDRMPDEHLCVLPDTDWLPYQWSLNNVVMAENAHAALGFWQANQPAAAFRLFKGQLLDSGFLGLCPGNFGCLLPQDMARGEAQRDFADAIGINARALVEGLFGVRPDLLDHQVMVAPGFPADWDQARMEHPDFTFDFQRHGLTETYVLESRFAGTPALRLQLYARHADALVTVNHQPAVWRWINDQPGLRRLEIECPAAARSEVIVNWQGGAVAAPAESMEPATAPPAASAPDWTHPLASHATLECVNLAPFFNDRVTRIFQNGYRAPRSSFASLACPWQGYGGWCEPDATFTVDDSGLRAVAAAHGGRLRLTGGLEFATPGAPALNNILFTSQWQRYPAEASVPLSGTATRLFLLMAGSTSPRQSHLDNGEVVVTCQDGSTTRLALRNPSTWWPIDQDYFTDDFAFRRTGPVPPRVDLQTGAVRLPDVSGVNRAGGLIPGGAATVLTLPLDGRKPLKSLTVRALANEVVIGLMAATLERTPPNQPTEHTLDQSLEHKMIPDTPGGAEP